MGSWGDWKMGRLGYGENGGNCIQGKPGIVWAWNGLINLK
jgi:hypothetical protein